MNKVIRNSLIRVVNMWTIIVISIFILPHPAPAGDVTPALIENRPYTDTPDQAGPVTATDKIVSRFMALDTDQNNTVSFDEYMTMVRERTRARFALMDRNGDGEVTDKEYRRFWKTRKAQWYHPKR